MAATSSLEASLARRDVLSEEERETLRSLPVERSTHVHGSLVVSGGLAPKGSCLLVEGMAMRVHRIGRAERVVSALHVPGDFLDLHSFLLEHLDHDIVAIGPCAIDFVATEYLEAITRDYPHLGRLLWLETLIDAKIHRMWVATRAALRGPQRVGHLVCELHARLGVVGLVRHDVFAMPLDQRGLAEVLGYSVVHVNHAVRDLRAAGLLDWSVGHIRVLDPQALAAFAGFDPDYLELRRATR